MCEMDMRSVFSNIMLVKGLFLTRGGYNKANVVQWLKKMQSIVSLKRQERKEM